MFETIKKLFTPVESLTPEQARDFMNKNSEGSYTLLDVRQPKEYEESHIAGATLVPLPQLTDLYTDLDRDKPIIVYCAIGGRSRVAAQMLAGKDFQKVFNLTGGIKAWNGTLAQGPQELKMDLIKGDETPVDVVALAYSMEQNLGSFYRLAQGKVSDPKVTNLLASLASIEEKHKDFLVDLYQKLESESESRQTLETKSSNTIMEGGFDTNLFLQQNEKFLEAESDILDLAMMLETQALDLYLRFASRMNNVDSQATLNKIADEEKQHLKALGSLRNQMVGN
ncbi:MAG: rhodanese-like domain-containing protein [Desulfomonilaceae bacterium]